MLRHPGLILVVLAPGLLAQTADPPPARKPPYQRLLSAADEKAVNTLQLGAGVGMATGNFDAAVQKFEEIVALRTRVQGADHWETVASTWDVVVAKTVGALPADRRTAWTKSAFETARGRDLLNKGKPAEAEPLLRAVCAECERTLGGKDPTTGIAYDRMAECLADLKKPAEARGWAEKAVRALRASFGDDHPRTATAVLRLAELVADGPTPADAEPLYRAALATRVRHLGEADDKTASACSELADYLEVRQQPAAALPLRSRALAGFQATLGPDAVPTLLAAVQLGQTLAHLRSYGEAEAAFDTAAARAAAALGRDHRLTRLARIGLFHARHGLRKYAEALPLAEEHLAVTLRDYGPEHWAAALAYSRLADVYDGQRRLADAHDLREKATRVLVKARGDRDPVTIQSYSDLADSLHRTGRGAEAVAAHQKAIALARAALTDRHELTADCYSGYAGCLYDLQRFDEAADAYRTAYDLNRSLRGDRHPSTARCRDSLAITDSSRGRYAEARPVLEAALAEHTAEYGEAHPETVTIHLNVAYNRFGLGDYAAAAAGLTRAARSYEAARMGVADRGLDRAAYGSERSPYTLLAAARANLKDPAGAWAAAEADLARGLGDETTARRGRPPEAAAVVGRLKAVQVRVFELLSRPSPTAEETAELARLRAERTGLSDKLAELSAAVGAGAVLPLARVQATLPADAAVVLWVDEGGSGVEEHWGCVVRRTGDPKWERLPGTGPDRKWTRDDRSLAHRYVAALAAGTEAEPLRRALAAQRFAPLRDHLAGARHLFVVPVHQMAGVPVDALTDDRPVSYVPSGSFLARARPAPAAADGRLLAVGDPVLPVAGAEPPLPPGGLLVTQVLPGGAADRAGLETGDVLVTYAGEELKAVADLGRLIPAQPAGKAVPIRVWRAAQGGAADREVAAGKLGVSLATEPARTVLAARRQSALAVAKLTRGEALAELPGAQIELARLAGLFPPDRVTTLVRAQATEAGLDRLRAAGGLAQYRYVHFATHGQANDRRAFDSVLVLTPPAVTAEPGPGAPYLDGRLTAREVIEFWKLDADLVTLSACETALGREGGGDGLLGFAQAFLLAGARSVCLSLWKVDDTATALLMDRFYRNLLGKREDGAKAMGKAAALHEAKAWLRDLTREQAELRLGALTDGVVRGEKKGRQVVGELPKAAARDDRPFAHPRYWAAFILIGDRD